MNKVFLNALLRAFSPSGYEENATQVVQNYLDGVANFEFIDKVGNAAFSVGSGDVKIMLSGHIDEIALQVQNIDDKGFIHFIKDGGVDPKVLPGSTVTIHTSNGVIHGVIGKAPSHIEYHGDDKDKAIKV